MWRAIERHYFLGFHRVAVACCLKAWSTRGQRWINYLCTLYRSLTVGILISMQRRAALNVEPWWSLYVNRLVLIGHFSVDKVSIETKSNQELRVTTFPRLSLRIMNIKGGIKKRGAEFTLVMFLSDLSKLHLHCRSPRRRSLSRSRSRYEHLLLCLLKTDEETSCFWV